MENRYSNIVKEIRAYFKENRFKKAVIGLSGGIDSSLAAKLVADAIGNNNLAGLIMPDKGVTSLTSVQHAMKIANMLKIRYELVGINSYLKPYKKLPWRENKTAIINTKSRARANILYNYANTHNALVVGTSNKSELMLGYFTKYGDGAVDIEVLGDLWKTEVFEMARLLRLPEEIIAKEPSAELFHGHTDEKELGAKYDTIDKILKKIKSGRRPKTALGKRILRRVKDNEHKRNPIKVISAK